MTAVFAYIMGHLPEIVAALFAIHAAALAICNMTATPKDNMYLARIYRVIEVFAGIVTKLSKT